MWARTFGRFAPNFAKADSKYKFEPSHLNAQLISWLHGKDFDAYVSLLAAFMDKEPQAFQQVLRILNKYAKALEKVNVDAALAKGNTEPYRIQTLINKANEALQGVDLGSLTYEQRIAKLTIVSNSFLSLKNVNSMAEVFVEKGHLDGEIIAELAKLREKH